jgi:hypothetical protein
MNLKQDVMEHHRIKGLIDSVPPALEDAGWIARIQGEL